MYVLFCFILFFFPCSFFFFFISACIQYIYIIGENYFTVVPKGHSNLKLFIVAAHTAICKHQGLCVCLLSFSTYRIHMMTALMFEWMYVLLLNFNFILVLIKCCFHMSVCFKSNCHFKTKVNIKRLHRKNMRCRKDEKRKRERTKVCAVAARETGSI